jgi:hypothetical protein
MARFTRSDLLAARQCPRRAWVQSNAVAEPTGSPPLPRADDRDAVREAARSRYPAGIAVPHDAPVEARLARTRELVADSAVQVVYDALFVHRDVEVRAAILGRNEAGWIVVEARSVISVGEGHELDLAAVAWLAAQCGLPVAGCRLLHFNRDYVRGDAPDPYALLAEVEVPLRDFGPALDALHAAADAPVEPDIAVGPHCRDPRPCPWNERCALPEGQWSVRQLPRSGRLLHELAELGIDDVRHIPSNQRMNPSQQHAVWSIVNDREYVGQGLRPALESVCFPIRFVDFEAAQPAVPRWRGTSPFTQLPTQWSMHIQAADGTVEHRQFLHQEDCDPRRAFVESLVAAAGTEGSIVVYSGAEAATLRGLRDRLPEHWEQLEAIVSRVVDMLPIVRDHYYHPALRGSFSMKAVLPAVCPELGYGDLRLQNGEMAARAWLRMIGPSTPAAEREELRASLLAYCARDTLAMLAVRARLLSRAGG